MAGGQEYGTACDCHHTRMAFQWNDYDAQLYRDAEYSGFSV